MGRLQKTVSVWAVSLAATRGRRTPPHVATPWESLSLVGGWRLLSVLLGRWPPEGVLLICFLVHQTSTYGQNGKEDKHHWQLCLALICLPYGKHEICYSCPWIEC